MNSNLKTLMSRLGSDPAALVRFEENPAVASAEAEVSIEDLGMVSGGRGAFVAAPWIAAAFVMVTRDTPAGLG